MKTHLFLTSVAVLMLTACPEVQVPMDFGAAPAQLDADDWNGLWENPASPGESMRIKIDPKRPNIVFAEELDDDEEEPTTFHLRRVSSKSDHDDLYFMLPESEDSFFTSTPYLLREADDGVLCFWMVNHDTVEAALESGTLKGKITRPDDKGSHCSLEAVKSNYTELIKPQYWEWLKPFFIYRSGRVE